MYWVWEFCVTALWVNCHLQVLVQWRVYSHLLICKNTNGGITHQNTLFRPGTTGTKLWHRRGSWWSCPSSTRNPDLRKPFKGGSHGLQQAAEIAQGDWAIDCSNSSGSGLYELACHSYLLLLVQLLKIINVFLLLLLRNDNCWWLGRTSGLRSANYLS